MSAQISTIASIVVIIVVQLSIGPTPTAAESDHNSDAPALNFDTFEAFRRHHNKTYLRAYNEERARQAFDANRRFIDDHNAGFESGQRRFAVRANHLADMTNDQYLRAYVRLTRSHRRKIQSLIQPSSNNSSSSNSPEPPADVSLTAVATSNTNSTTVAAAPNNSTTASSERSRPATALRHRFAQLLDGGGDLEALPPRLDWRDRGFRPEVKNQKSCGACYAFAIALAVEAQLFKRTGQMVGLSEQQLLDCTATARAGNHGCAGGSLRNTLRYVRSSGGLMRDEDYPYVAAQHDCQYNARLAVAQITSWDVLAARDERAMQAAVAHVGPIAVSINASPKSFQLYSHGVYDDADACSSQMVNHAMLLVGYTEDAWILKNWWGARWGDGGYMHIARGKNMCGLANYVAYAVI